MEKFIKNIEHEKVQKLTDLVSAEKGQVVSKTLAQNKAVSITTHDSTGDAMVSVLEGVGEFTVGGVKHTVRAGESIVMPAAVPHSVYAPENFKWLLTVVFPDGYGA